MTNNKGSMWWKAVSTFVLSGMALGALSLILTLNKRNHVVGPVNHQRDFVEITNATGWRHTDYRMPPENKATNFLTISNRHYMHVGGIYLFHFTEYEWRLITNYYGQYMTDSVPFKFSAPLIPATGP